MSVEVLKRLDLKYAIIGNGEILSSEIIKKLERGEPLSPMEFPGLVTKEGIPFTRNIQIGKDVGRIDRTNFVDNKFYYEKGGL